MFSRSTPAHLPLKVVSAGTAPIWVVLGLRVRGSRGEWALRC